ncbi:heat shock 70 kDa protein 12A [Lingula anatina]|uniref:Heat shock 70 kDa protein 12A n=1 Tax=Lingula anatina TaxID=7574 RepID=A0A1S3IAE5_LINAN|nr:heat shock 70 kDa protein 12A [Lingula anatina]|eukprot:XP_013395232.1 heat shock 70 kDa protein 12A [Lingula anatina]
MMDMSGLFLSSVYRSWVDNERTQSFKEEAGPKAETPENPFCMVAAIDFGTTFSGYAYSFTSNESDIYINANWGASVGQQLYRTPTTVLISPDQSEAYFGFEAQQKFLEELEPEEVSEWYLFERFKMKLNAELEINPRTTMLQADNGKSLPAQVVFSHAIRLLKEHLLESQKQSVLATEVLWVITVPSVWSDQAKEFMRLSAIKAGIPREQQLIAYEPEAASLYYLKQCKQTPQRNPAGTVSLDINKPGVTFMVADLGGGTADITVQEIDRTTLKPKILSRPTGGPWGGDAVNVEFEKLLDSVFGKEKMDGFRALHPDHWHRIIREFEIKKRTLSPVKQVPTRLVFPAGFLSYASSHQMSLAESCNMYEPKGALTWSIDKIRISSDVMRGLFERTIKAISNHLLEFITTNENNISFLVLVGGFSDCPLLQEAITERFKGRLKVITPGNDGGLCVVKGAVVYGQNPAIFKQRVAGYTYGIECVEPFDKNSHPIELKEVYEGGVEKCARVFKTIIKKDESVKEGEVRKLRFHAVRSRQNSMTLPVYASEKKDVKFTNEEKTWKIADLEVRMPIQKGGTKRQVEVLINFSRTTISVRALDLASNNTTEATLNFFNDYS